MSRAPALGAERWILGALWLTSLVKPTSFMPRKRPNLKKKKGGERLRKTPILTPVLYIHVCTRAHTHMNIYIHLPMHTCKKITN